jgi:hypothetical protein
MDKTDLDELLSIIKRCNMDKNDVIQEAELIEECGEYYHVSLIGYSAEELRTAANTM